MPPHAGFPGAFTVAAVTVMSIKKQSSTKTKMSKGVTPDQARHLARILLPILYRNLGRDTSSREMYAKTGIPAAVIDALKKGSNKGLGLGTLVRIRDYSGVSIDELVGLTPLEVGRYEDVVTANLDNNDDIPSRLMGLEAQVAALLDEVAAAKKKPPR